MAILSLEPLFPHTQISRLTGAASVCPQVSTLASHSFSAFDLCGTLGHSCANTTIAPNLSELTSIASPFPFTTMGTDGYPHLYRSFPPPQQVNFADLRLN